MIHCRQIIYFLCSLIEGEGKRQPSLLFCCCQIKCLPNAATFNSCLSINALSFSSHFCHGGSFICCHFAIAQYSFMPHFGVAVQKWFCMVHEVPFFLQSHHFVSACICFLTPLPNALWNFCCKTLKLNKTTNEPLVAHFITHSDLPFLFIFVRHISTTSLLMTVRPFLPIMALFQMQMLHLMEICTFFLLGQ